MAESIRAKTIISVIGASSPSRKVYSLALEVGRLLAGEGLIVACGGLGGVMEAVCKGTAERGGLSLGFLPRESEEANPYVTIPVPTGLGEARNILVVSSGAAVISIGGSLGTLSEMGFALKLGKPLVGLHSWTVTDDGGTSYPLMRASSPREAVKMALMCIVGRA
jgi:uncharacterized protein (TIGR00725 family)